jgi:hypothetical protein
MSSTPTPAQSAASRHNGARSHGPASEAGKARAALNGVRHGLCGRTFFLLADEDPAEFAAHEGTWLAAWRRATCTSTRRPWPLSGRCGARSAPAGWRSR